MRERTKKLSVKLTLPIYRSLASWLVVGWLAGWLAGTTIIATTFLIIHAQISALGPIKAS